MSEDLAYTSLLSGPNDSAKVEFDSSPSYEKSFCFQGSAGMVLPKGQDLFGGGSSGLSQVQMARPNPNSQTTQDIEGLILYDGVCALCNWSVRLVLKHDRNARFRFAPLQGETARAVLTRHPQISAGAQSVLLVRAFDTPYETVLQRSEAALAILDRLGGFWRTWTWLRVLPLRVRDAAYDFVARHRYRWFGKYDTCPLPKPEWRDRFLP